MNRIIRENGLQQENKSNSTPAVLEATYRNNQAPLLEVLDQRNGVLLEVGQAAVNGLGIVVRSSLLLSSFLQPLLQAVAGAGQEHDHVRGADLPGGRVCVKPKL